MKCYVFFCQYINQRSVLLLLLLFFELISVMTFLCSFLFLYEIKISYFIPCKKTRNSVLEEGIFNKQAGPAKLLLIKAFVVGHWVVL